MPVAFQGLVVTKIVQHSHPSHFEALKQLGIYLSLKLHFKSVKFLLNLTFQVSFFTILLPGSFSRTSLAVTQSQNISCEPSNSRQSFNLASNLMQVATWVGRPALLTSKLIVNLGPQVLASLFPSSGANIQERARIAKVPVIMYHDILPQKEVFFDVTPQDFAAALKLIQAQGLTPISIDQLVTHLRTGLPLAKKPILLTFDDGYGGHYQYVYPLLKKYGYPAVFSIYTSGVGKNNGRSHISWENLRKMAADPLITIASHSLTHPRDLRKLPDDKLHQEVVESKRVLEAELGVPIRYFTYPEGNYDQRVAKVVQQAGYLAALTMSNVNEGFAGQSESLLAIQRLGQSRLRYAIEQAWGGPQLPIWNRQFNFASPVQRQNIKIDRTPLILISGGKPITIHAKSRYQVPEIIAGKAIAAVDGGFFSLKYLDSNVMIGPILSQDTGKFIPGNNSENRKLANRPLVLINSYAVNFIGFDPLKHNTLAGLQSEMTDVTDAFVAAAWLVKNGQPQSAETFANLYSFEVPRHRAFWGINQIGEPVIGVSTEPIDSVGLGVALAKADFRDAVMLDSGASTSLVYEGKSLVRYTPRPVPHVVALVSPQLDANNSVCLEASRRSSNQIASMR